MPILPGILGAIARSAPKPLPSGQGILDFITGLGSAVIPGIGAQASARLQRQWALEDRDFQNEYNTPANQLKRLKDAGLPAAAFFSGGVSSQSDQPRSVNIDPTLGAAEGIQNYFKNRMTTLQAKIMEQELRSLTAKADVDVITANFMKGHSYTPSVYGTTIRQETKLNAEMDSKNLSNFSQRIANDINRHVYDLQQEFGHYLQSEQLAKLFNENAAIRQMNLDRQQMLEFQREFIRLYNEGDLSKALGRLIGMMALRSQGK